MTKTEHIAIGFLMVLGVLCTVLIMGATGFTEGFVAGSAGVLLGITAYQGGKLVVKGLLQK